MVTTSATELVLVSGSLLSLSCSIRLVLVDTPTNIISSWSTPSPEHDILNVSNTSLELTKAVVETADSGVYVCSTRVIDSSSHSYVKDSELVTNETNIIISKFHKFRICVLTALLYQQNCM